MSDNMQHKALSSAKEPEMCPEMVRVRVDRLRARFDHVEATIKAIQAARAAGKRWVPGPDGWELG